MLIKYVVRNGVPLYPLDMPDHEANHRKCLPAIARRYTCPEMKTLPAAYTRAMFIAPRLIQGGFRWFRCFLGHDDTRARRSIHPGRSSVRVRCVSSHCERRDCECHGSRPFMRFRDVDFIVFNIVCHRERKKTLRKSILQMAQRPVYPR